MQLGINGTQDTQRVINDQSTVTINADGKLNAYGNQQTIGNLIMSGGDIDTNGTTGHYGLLATNGNTSITVQ